MALRSQKKEGDLELFVLSLMIVSHGVLSKIASKWEWGMFPSMWANVIADACVAYFKATGHTPNRSIEMDCEKWVSEHKSDRETADALLGFLERAFTRATKVRNEGNISVEDAVNRAAALFQRHRLGKLAENVAGALENGDDEKAQRLVEDHRKVELGLGAGINVLAKSSEPNFESVFMQRRESIIEYPGAAKGFFRGALASGRFVAFMGKEKVGKSFWLGDMAWRGVEQGLNVAYFEAGDQVEADVLARFSSRITGRSLDGESYSWPTDIEYTDKLSLPGVTSESVRCKPLTKKETFESIEEWRKKVGETRFKLSCHANSTLSVAGIEEILWTWDQDDWHPDVIVIDYADILAPPVGKSEERDSINETWKALRALSQKTSSLVVTATQADAKSYDAYTLKRENFSNDKRKYSHVTGMIGINQTDKEKALEVYRLNWILRRDLSYPETTCLATVSCLAVANPCVVSTIKT